MSDELLRHPVHSGHLLVGALKRHKDKPVLFLGDTTLSGGEMADRISQYIQAFEALGAGTGATAGLLSLNRPEVLMITGAGQTQGYRRMSLHPLGSLDDHAYVLSDGGVTTLIVDPNPAFVERALGLLDKVDSLKQILTIGPVPEAMAHLGDAVKDCPRRRPSTTPRPLVAADLAPDTVTGLTYTGGTTGKPKGVMMTSQATTTMTTIQLAEWEWPDAPRFLMITPLSHAGAAYFLPTLVKGGEMYVLPKFDPGEVLKTIEEKRITATFMVPAMLYALMDHPDSHTRDLSSLETVYYGASAINPVRLAEAIRRFGRIFAQNYGQSEAPMAISYLAKDEHDEKRLSSCGRPTLFARCALLDARRQPGAAGRGRRGVCVRAAAGRRLLAVARADRRHLQGRLAAHRGHGPRGRRRLLVHRRPGQGHDRHRRVQRVPARGRGRRRRASRRRPGVRGRHSGRQVGRGRHRGGGAARRRRRPTTRRSRP